MDDRILGVGTAVLKLANWLNWICVAVFAAVLVASVPFAAIAISELTTRYGEGGAAVLHAVRFLFGLGILAGVAAHVVFTRLLAIVATVRGGDPFVAANAARLGAIGWAVLAIQLLDLAFGATSGWLTVRGIAHAGWAPSVGGWISVLMIFVLARVFTIGARMRDELEGTV